MIGWVELSFILLLITLLVIAASFGSWSKRRATQLSGRRFYRNDRDKLVAGVCAGAADYFSLKCEVMRILALILCLVTGLLPGAIIYGVFAVVLPVKNRS